MFSFLDIAARVDALSGRHPGRSVWLRVPGAQVERSTFPVACTLAGHNHGQERDLRYALADGRSLHEHVMPDGYSVFHIDRANPCAPGGLLAHGAADTAAPVGALAGLGLVVLTRPSFWGGFGIVALCTAAGAAFASREAVVVDAE